MSMSLFIGENGNAFVGDREIIEVALFRKFIFFNLGFISNLENSTKDEFQTVKKDKITVKQEAKPQNSLSHLLVSVELQIQHWLKPPPTPH